MTEAEWEYAARAGTTTKWYCGNSEGCLPSVAVYSINSGGQTAPVGSKSANDFGLYDMHGNVWQWVQDCYVDGYDDAPSDGRAVQGNTSCLHVCRGGSWNFDPWSLRSAIRNWNAPESRLIGLGFRVARTLPLF